MRSYPKLFESTATDYTTNGIGRITPIACTVAEERNGPFELECDISNDDRLFDEVKLNRIVYCETNDSGQREPFRIYKIEKKTGNQSTIYAQHITYDLSKKVTTPFTASTASECVKGLASHTIDSAFTFDTDLPTVANFHLDEPTQTRSILGGVDGSVLDVYGGEWQFTGTTCKLCKARGSDNGVTLRFGKNITDLTNEMDASNVVGAVYPYYKSTGDDATVITLDGDGLVKSEYYDQLPTGSTKVIDFTSSISRDDTTSSDSTDGDAQDTALDVSDIKSQLESLAKSYLENNKLWLAKQNITVSFVALWQTPEYQNVAPLERVSLCDTVTVKYTALDVDVKMKCIKTVYNVVNGRYDSIELGDARTNLSQAIMDSAVKEVFGADAETVKSTLNNATRLINGGENGYVVFNRNANGAINEILVMNTADRATATEVLRINKNGIGFSNGYNKPFTTAWTLDGSFNADNITAGTISDAQGLTGWNLDTGEFWLTSNSDDGGTISLANGTVSTYNSSGYMTMQMYNGGLIWWCPWHSQKLIGRQDSAEYDETTTGSDGTETTTTYHALQYAVDKDTDFVVARFNDLHEDGTASGDTHDVINAFNNDDLGLYVNNIAVYRITKGDDGTYTQTPIAYSLAEDGAYYLTGGRFHMYNKDQNIGVHQNSDGNLELFNDSNSNDVKIVIRGGGRIECTCPSGFYVNGTKRF